MLQQIPRAIHYSWYHCTSNTAKEADGAGAGGVHLQVPLHVSLFRGVVVFGTFSGYIAHYPFVPIVHLKLRHGRESCLGGTEDVLFDDVVLLAKRSI